MVDPISDRERRSFYRRLRVGVALLVGASAGLITLQADEGAFVTAGVIALGLAVGALLAWFVVPAGPQEDDPPSRPADADNPFADGSGQRRTERERRERDDGGRSDDRRD